MELAIRKLVTVVEEVLADGGRPVAQPVKVAVAMAVIRNPYAGQFVADLMPMVNAFAPALGELLGQRAVAALGLPVEAYGKGALVGLAGEVEHGSALIHTLRFGDPFRAAAGGTTLLPSAEKVGPAGASLDLALKHKLDQKIRSHHQTFEVRIPDAPRPDEIVIACAVASSGRPHPRSGSLHAELAAKGERQE